MGRENRQTDSFMTRIATESQGSLLRPCDVFDGSMLYFWWNDRCIFDGSMVCF